MERIAVSIVVRNEDDFLDEFLQYYISLGFKNFIILDDESSDDTIKIINWYNNIVNCIIIPVNVPKIISNITDKINQKIPDEKLFFHGIGSDLISKYIKIEDYDYILIVDIDEFLYIKPEFNLINFLTRNKNHNISSIIIPRLEAGDFENFKNNILNLETLKYTYVSSEYDSYKHFCDPNNSVYYNAHISFPINNSLCCTQKNIYNFNLISDIHYKEKITNPNLIIYHFKTKNMKIWEKNNKKYRQGVGNNYRRNIKNYIQSVNSINKIDKLDIIKYSKNIFKIFFDKYGFIIIRNFIETNEIIQDTTDINLKCSENFLKIQYKHIKTLIKIKDILSMLGNINITSFSPIGDKTHGLEIVPKGNTEFIPIILKRQGVILITPSIKYKFTNSDDKINWFITEYYN